MVGRILKNLKIETFEIIEKNTNKALFARDEDYEYFQIGCAIDSWSSIFPQIMVSKKDIKKIRKFSETKVLKAYKKLLIMHHCDMRKISINWYENSAMKELFGADITKEIENFKTQVIATKKEKRVAFIKAYKKEKI